VATLTVTATEDYSDGNPLLASPTDAIVFNTAGGSIIATFGSNQFAPSGPITNTIAVTGDSDSNDFVRVNVAIGGAFTAAGWSFNNWWGAIASS
jgi:hypothetical protein